MNAEKTFLRITSIIAGVEYLMCIIVRNRPNDWYYTVAGANTYRNIMAICLMLWSIAPILHKSNIVRVFGAFSFLIMSYTLLDNIFWDVKSFDMNDATLISSILTLLILALVYYRKSLHHTFADKVNVGIISMVVIGTLFSRNHIDLLNALNVPFVNNASIYYHGDALFKIPAALYILYNTKYIYRCFGIIYLFLVIQWGFTEFFLDATSPKNGSHAITAYILTSGVWLVTRYKYQNNYKLSVILDKLAITSHAYLIIGIACLYIRFLSTNQLVVQLISIAGVIILSTIILYKKIWKEAIRFRMDWLRLL